MSRSPGCAALFQEHQRQHESADKEKESLTQITPAVKVRVLRNGITAANVQGYLDPFVGSNRIKPRALRFDSNALAAAERFYQANPAWSAGDLIRVMIHCEGMDHESSESYDEHWHARNGSDLRFLLCNLDSVLQGLRLAAQMPLVKFISKEALFPNGINKTTSATAASQG